MTSLLAIALLIALAPPARAQTLDALLGRAQPDQAISLDVEFGLAGSRLPAGWTPLQVSIFSSEALSGLLEIETAGESAPPVRLRTPFTTTPGRATPVHLAIPLPGFGPTLRIRALDARGRVLETLRFGLDDPARPVPARVVVSRLVLASVGASSIRRIHSGAPPGETEIQPRSGTAPPPNASSAADLQDAALIALELETLPTLWKGYDGIGAVVIDASVMERVSAQAIEAILTWTRAGGRLVLIADRPSANLARWLHAPLPAFGEPAAAPDSDAIVRPIAIPPSMRAQGWTTRSKADTPYLAEGPLGMGWMVILAADPDGFFPESSPAADWARILDRALARELEAMGEQRRYPDISDADVSAALDALAADLNVPDPPIALLLGLLALLAIALGPVDYFVLKALGRRHRSWLSALAWIALFTILAYALPFWMRPSQTSYRRLALVDVNAAQDSAWRTAVTGALLGQPGALPLDGFAPGTWARPTVGGEFRGGLFDAPMPLALDRSAAGSAVPLALAGRVWTFQTIIEDGAVDSPWRAVVERRSEDEGYDVHLEGSPDLTPARAALRTRDGLRALPLEERAAGRWRAGAGRIARSDHSFWAGRFDAPPTRRDPWRRAAGISDAQALPAAIDRGRTLEALVRTGEWAVVCFVVENHPPHVAPRLPANSAQTTLYRILAPVIDAGAPDP